MQGIQRISGVVTLTGEQFVYDLNAAQRHQLTAVLTPDDLKGYEEEREQMLKLFTSHFYPGRLKIRCRQNLNIEELGEYFVVKFRWKDDVPMPIWDSAGNRLTEPAAINAGAKVKLAFQQVAWGEKLSEVGHERQHQYPNHGTVLKLRGIQLIKESEVSCDKWDEDDIRSMFGVHPGGFIREGTTTPPRVVAIHRQDIHGLNERRGVERPSKLVR